MFGVFKTVILDILSCTKKVHETGIISYSFSSIAKPTHPIFKIILPFNYFIWNVSDK
jgi:hypothetical protein